MSRILRRAAAATLLAIVAGLAPTLVQPAVAAAPPTAPRLTDATHRAAALRKQVDRLTTAAEVASEDFNAAQSRVSDIITGHLLAQRQLSDLRATSAGNNQVADDRVRAMYMTGGPAGLVSTVLGARDLGDAVSRLHAVQSLVGDDRSRAAERAAVIVQAAAIEAQLKVLSAQRLAAEKVAAAAADRVRASLAASRQLLAGADADVRRIAAEERRAAERAAARAFAVKLAAARSTAARRAAAAARAAGAAGRPGAAGAVGNPAPSGTAAAVVAAARSRLGDPYVWGATGPDTFDCSGLTGWAYLQAGVRLPRTSRQQWLAGPHVALAALAPGDLLFWASDPAQPASIHHVALYIGGGSMIAAPQPGDVVKVQDVYLDGYAGAVRPGG